MSETAFQQIYRTKSSRSTGLCGGKGHQGQHKTFKMESKTIKVDKTKGGVLSPTFFFILPQFSSFSLLPAHNTPDEEYFLPSPYVPGEAVSIFYITPPVDGQVGTLGAPVQIVQRGAEFTGAGHKEGKRKTEERTT